ncbi:MAG: AMP-binding protein [Bacteroidales bacterium]|jgi:O-succinylbenzoic acid--CoA ligase|nr:AMP-binding protein [Bacteroidales bacterium]
MKTYDQIKINGKIYSPLSIQNLTQDFPSALSLEVLEFLQIWFNKEKTITQQSSGSTGLPKIIKLHKEAMIASAKITGNYFGFRAGMKALLCLSPGFISGKMMIVRALVWEMNLILGKTNNNPVKDLTETIDFSAMVPLQLVKIVQQNPEKLARFKTIIIGGSAIPLTLEKQLIAFETDFYHTYGMTETMSHIALRKIDGDQKNYFRPLPGVNLQQDKRSCLVIQAEALGIKKLITNDIVHIQSDNSFRILGRWDEVIISAGLKIHPQIVEQKLSRHIHKLIVMIGKADETAGEIAVLVIEDQPASSQIFQYWQLLEQLLEPAEIPRQLYFIQSMPLLASGKPDRKSLQKII